MSGFSFLELHIDLGLKEPATLEIVGKDLKKIFEIDKDGKVFWLRNGKLTRAKTDTDLSLAFAVAVIAGAGYGYYDNFIYKSAIERIKAGESNANKI